MLSSIDQKIVTSSNDGPLLTKTRHNILGAASESVSIPINPVGRPYGTRGAPNPNQKQKQVRGVGRPRKQPQQTHTSCQPSTNVQINPTVTFDSTVNFCTTQPFRISPSSIRVGSSPPNLCTPNLTPALQPIVVSSTSKYYLFKVFYLFFINIL